ncbi:PEP-CTERM sorting domain-containing protein [Sulfuriroseicoccus oceanibius]|uniref:PEP-CTERM sorting domain-containing protein n=1 Tax=Sulfuriroseicoccus oceanibius TaxID=2707525 RepID=A0A6B3LCB2_9BACT|nr:PEP-CTERM sorting domain-containing protein [Sulfuriroseicoccus oceanibius]QQL44910.1 PEP-CTERM sorting domain-containing protein [Sulfuriroseicoccus oceanibius]
MKIIPAIALAATFVGAASAATVSISNNSFESPGANGGFTFQTPTDWTNEGGSVFLEDITSVGFSLGTADGADFLTLQDTGTVSQNLGVSYIAGNIYTLTLAITNRTGQANTNSGIFALHDDNGELASFSVDTTAFTGDQVNNFNDYSFDYTATGAEVGNITVVLSEENSSGRFHIDNVRLTAVPEPSSAALLGLGGLAMILIRRK